MTNTNYKILKRKLSLLIVNKSFLLWSSGWPDCTNDFGKCHLSFEPCQSKLKIKPARYFETWPDPNIIFQQKFYF